MDKTAPPTEYIRSNIGKRTNSRRAKGKNQGNENKIRNVAENKKKRNGDMKINSDLGKRGKKKKKVECSAHTHPYTTTARDEEKSELEQVKQCSPVRPQTLTPISPPPSPADPLHNNMSKNTT